MKYFWLYVVCSGFMPCLFYIAFLYSLQMVAFFLVSRVVFIFLYFLHVVTFTLPFIFHFFKSFNLHPVAKYLRVTGSK